MSHKGWHRRGYIPHCDYGGLLQAVTFRLADSLPSAVVASWRRELERDLDGSDPVVKQAAEAVLRRKIAIYEDAGHGSCLLRHPAHAAIVQRSLMLHHGMRYRLIEWCVMPNHVHVMFRPSEGFSLGKILQGWKGGSSVEINRLSQREGPLWMRDYHDRLIRVEDHFRNARSYIRQNPVKAKLCAEPEDWPFSSAGVKWSEQADHKL
jgi:REP element-mobilizing transposase RayT